MGAGRYSGERSPLYGSRVAAVIPAYWAEAATRHPDSPIKPSRRSRVSGIDGMTRREHPAGSVRRIAYDTGRIGLAIVVRVQPRDDTQEVDDRFDWNRACVKVPKTADIVPRSDSAKPLGKLVEPLPGVGALT
jgi:hypothetical protein